jgi:DNA modification methylase
MDLTMHEASPSPNGADPRDKAEENAARRWSGLTSTGTSWEVCQGDARDILPSLPDESIGCVVTSPPYFWQRDYGADGQIGHELTIRAYVEALANVLDEVRRILASDGLLFLNLGDTYYSAKGKPQGRDRKNGARRFKGLRVVDTTGLGVPKKTAIGIPWRVAIELIDRGWILRCPIIWQRARPLPEPNSRDRPWRTYETVFMFSKSTKYHFDRQALKACGNEDIWIIHSQSQAGGRHSAVFPADLVQRCLDVGCKPGVVVFDPFAGSGTVLEVALRTARSAVGIELNPDFCRMILDRVSGL